MIFASINSSKVTIGTIGTIGTMRTIGNKNPYCGTIVPDCSLGMEQKTASNFLKVKDCTDCANCTVFFSRDLKRARLIIRASYIWRM